jgi:hypothetical protein
MQQAWMSTHRLYIFAFFFFSLSFSGIALAFGGEGEDSVSCDKIGMGHQQEHYSHDTR